jgi:hypothetical protein
VFRVWHESVAQPHSPHSMQGAYLVRSQTWAIIDLALGGWVRAGRCPADAYWAPDASGCGPGADRDDRGYPFSGAVSYRHFAAPRGAE